jgi:hypothetical protein
LIWERFPYDAVKSSLFQWSEGFKTWEHLGRSISFPWIWIISETLQL